MTQRTVKHEIKLQKSVIVVLGILAFGVVANAFQPSAGVGNYVLTYTMAGCQTTINVTVNNGPVTGPIQHY